MIAIDNAGQIVVAWEEYDFPNSTNIYVKRWNGTLWAFVGGVLDKTLANNSFAPSLAIDSTNRPVVAWHELAGSNFNVYVKRFNGTSWQTLGTTVDQTSGSNAVDVSIKVGSNNNPVVSWEEEGNILVKRWTGTAWTLVSSGAADLNIVNNATRPALTLNGANNPIVAFQEDTPADQNNIYVKGF